MSRQDTPPPDPAPSARRAGQTCAVCGAHNASWRFSCEKCGARLVRPEDDPPPPPPGPRRPAWVTGWALLMALYVIGSVITVVAGAASSVAGDPLAPLLLVISGVALLAGLVVIVGVWQLHAWARLPAIALHGVLIALLVASIVQGGGSDVTPMSQAESVVAGADVCGTVVWVGLNVFFMVVFARQQELFER